MSSLGFLTDWRRLNVAVTRARSGMVVVGDEQTLKADRYWGRLLELMERKGAMMQEQEVADLFAEQPLQPRPAGSRGSSNPVNFLLLETLDQFDAADRALPVEGKEPAPYDS